jgi:hypothetical protein
MSMVWANKMRSALGTLLIYMRSAAENARQSLAAKVRFPD